MNGIKQSRGITLIHFDGKFIDNKCDKRETFDDKGKKDIITELVLMHLEIFAVALERVKGKIAKWPFEIKKKRLERERKREKKERARTHHWRGSSNEQHALQASAF